MENPHKNNIYLSPLRNYRKIESAHEDEQKFQIIIEETDLLITIPKYINTDEAFDKCFQYMSQLRKELKEYIFIHPAFQHSLEPITSRTNAPSIVKAMCNASQYALVGPFAAVAGSISQLVSQMLVTWITQKNQQKKQEYTKQNMEQQDINLNPPSENSQSVSASNTTNAINASSASNATNTSDSTNTSNSSSASNASNAINVIVENGGDIYMYSQKERVIGILSNPTEGESIGLKIHKEDFPVSICSSSSKIGHSLSFGNGDIAMVRAKNAALADALATAYCNMLKTSKDINKVIAQAQKDAHIKIPHNPFDNKEITRFLKEENPLTHINLFKNSLPKNNSLGGLEGVFLQCDGHIGAWGQIELVAL